PAPNTLAIAALGKGMIPVRDLSAKAGRETIAALHQLFYHLRQNQIEGLAVCRGALSEAEQRDWQLERVKLHSAGMSLEDALAAAQREVEAPGQSEHQQGYAVDIRLYPTWSGAADARPLERTAQGRALLQCAWRYGFIRRYPDASDQEDKACHFRYVGLAHSTAMTWLNLRLEDYLQLLHEKGVIQIHENGIPRYVIVCAPIVDGYASALIPEGTACEASSDNQGYAVIACTYE
ncbi:MAG: D-alanyl-D-alanine carboxypeptidase family protein, partial [Eubacteriales bacterium]|nr:D-alanyl-D-alanine carboxypeptidase family protein [Eubacteriales bacterium]